LLKIQLFGDFMDSFLMLVIIICALIITVAVIMQPSKDGGLGGLASGGVTNSVLGANRNDFLAKSTWWLMGIFLISSIALAKHQTRERNEAQEKLTKQSIIEEADTGSGQESSIKPDPAKGDIEKAVEDIKKDGVEKVDDAKSDVEKAVEDIKKDGEEGADKAADEKDSLIKNLKEDGLKLDSGSDKK
jgi:protein translocase SecG subunit